jgi:hypothetical protein
MPCSKYKGKQRGLCYATKEWKDFSKIKRDYCPKCRKRTEHFKSAGEKMCKTCGHREETFKAGNLLK